MKVEVKNVNLAHSDDNDDAHECQQDLNFVGSCLTGIFLTLTEDLSTVLLFVMRNNDFTFTLKQFSL